MSHLIIYVLDVFNCEFLSYDASGIRGEGGAFRDIVIPVCHIIERKSCLCCLLVAIGIFVISVKHL